MLYVCATPIGNLGDVTPRVLDALRAADLIAAEDTRHTRKLLSHFDIHTPLTSLFKHNEAQKTEEVLQRLRDGQDVALVTDAGMPGVSDPGMRLVGARRRRRRRGDRAAGPVRGDHRPRGRPATRATGFRFVGYLPRRARELEAALRRWRGCGGLVVAFETGQRLARSLAVLAAALPEAPAAVCRELTKVHEEVVRGTLRELSERYPMPGHDAGPRRRARRDHPRPRPRRSRRTRRRRGGPQVGGRARDLLARGLSRRDTAAALHVCLGLPRREAESVWRRDGRRAGADRGRLLHCRHGPARRASSEGTLLLDGAMGSELMRRGLRRGRVPRGVERHASGRRGRHPPRLLRGRLGHREHQHLRRLAR